MILIVVLIFPIIIDGLYSSHFNGGDDHMAYLVIPVKMLQQGTLRIDPFNYRMNISGLGGFSFLQAGIIRFFGIEAINIIDRTVGLYLIIGGFFGLYIRKPNPLIHAFIIMFYFFVICIHHKVNITAHYISFALLFGLFCLIIDNGMQSWKNAVLMAVLLSALISIKNLFIPFSILLFYISAFIEFTMSKKNALNILKNVFISTIVAIGLILFWLKPFLYTHVSLIDLNYGTINDSVSLNYCLYWANRRGLFAFLFAYILISILSLMIVFFKKGDNKLGITLFFSSMLSTLAVNFFTGCTAIDRYTYHIILFTTVIFITLGFSCIQSKAVSWIALILLMAGGIGFYWKDNNTIKHLRKYLSSYTLVYGNLFNGEYKPYINPAELDKIRRIQKITEPGSGILVRTYKPFLFDFNRNDIYIPDVPCASSLPPGMPCFEKEERIIGYLLSNSIRYIIYNYGYYGENTDFLKRRTRLLQIKMFTPWQKAINRRILEFQEKLKGISHDRKRIYDDGMIYIIDLLSSPK